MFEKIEDYYIARVSKLENINYGDGNLVQEKIQKFVCVKKKDNHSKRGLLHKVGQRKSLLNYLIKNDVTRYRKVIKELGLRK